MSQYRGFNVLMYALYSKRSLPPRIAITSIIAKAY